MANYPSTLPIARGSLARVTDDGRLRDKVGDGLARIRKLHADRVVFTFRHVPLSVTLQGTLATFYATYPTGTFYFVAYDDGATYTVAFDAAPVPRIEDSGLRSYEIRLVQVA